MYFYRKLKTQLEKKYVFSESHITKRKTCSLFKVKKYEFRNKLLHLLNDKMNSKFLNLLINQQNITINNIRYYDMIFKKV